MSIRRALLAVPFVVFAAACGENIDIDSFPVDEPAETVPADTIEPVSDAVADDAVVFVWSETGGCAMAGPNCARYEVTADGTVGTSRQTADGYGEVEVAGTVDVALVEAWLAAVADIDMDQLQERVGAGEMTAAFDGTDVVVEAPTVDVQLSSIDTNFSPSEDVFASGRALAAAAFAAAPLELEMR